MKRFTSEGANEQGRQPIPAQTNAQEAPLGLSFEGGLAGPRRYSRRQAIGLLGGSLAGVGLLSTGLAAPAKSLVGIGPGRQLKQGDQIHLESLGDKPGPRWLDGRTQDGTVGLAPNTEPPYTGTLWTVSVVSDYRNYYAFYCEGTGPGDARWLDGRTDAGDVVLSPTTNKPFTGTRWWIHLVP
jgi:hypothetical protein